MATVGLRRSDILVRNEHQTCGEHDDAEDAENSQMGPAEMNGDNEDEKDGVCTATDGRREDSLAGP